MTHAAPSARLRPSPPRPEAERTPCGTCGLSERIEAVERQLELLVGLTQEHLRGHSPRRFSGAFSAPPKGGTVDVQVGDKRFRAGTLTALAVVAILTVGGVVGYVGKWYVTSPRAPVASGAPPK